MSEYDLDSNHGLPTSVLVPRCVCVYICAYHIWFFIFSPFSPSILFLVFTREILQHSITRLVLFC